MNGPPEGMITPIDQKCRKTIKLTSVEKKVTFIQHEMSNTSKAETEELVRRNFRHAETTK